MTNLPKPIALTESHRRDAAQHYCGTFPDENVEHWVKTDEGVEHVPFAVVDLAYLLAERDQSVQKAAVEVFERYSENKFNTPHPAVDVREAFALDLEVRSSRIRDLGKLVTSLLGVDVLPEDTDDARAAKFKKFTSLFNAAIVALSVVTDIEKLVMKQFQLPQRIVEEWRRGQGPTNMVMTRRQSAIWLADMVQRHLIDKEEYVEKNPVKVHKLTVLVIDHENYGVESCKQQLQDVDGFHVSVLSSETAEVDWTDDHPLNKHDGRDAAVAALFPKDVP